jgi:beta-glucosidase
MAPPQSYMNFDNSHFSRYVNLTEPDRAWHSEFHYFGANVYSYLLARYGDFVDFISMQLYESYSLAAMAVYHENISPENYLVSYIQDLVIKRQSKYLVDFSTDAQLNMPDQFVHLPLSKLVIGLANGWATGSTNEKHIYISPEQVETAYKSLKKSTDGDITPRGFMFWTIEEEGTNNVYLARGLRKVLGIRDS